ncbi:hypothetical protein C2S53_019740 [Perilla frutescens var. hirtella]|uniref:Uncharacterized protein n=1 Tax=Perilla frutescens var. hirtella TaxID=608512 RepID=A0AAD4IZG3_PERFH|nr:hypothetical protein C2S51_006937 [Perilla frutescens var. frutescens]KAH6824390.1 hypothetical protein C2S53_019740 [Perilla frutescens var. hirtella]
MDLSCAKSELSKYQNLGLLHHHQGINLLGAAAAAASRDHHHFHHQLFLVTNQQMIRAFDSGSGYNASSLLAVNMSASIGFQQLRAAGMAADAGGVVLGFCFV